MDDLRQQLATEGQMGTATIAYVWPLIEAALLRERSDTAEKIADEIASVRDEEYPNRSSDFARGMTFASHLARAIGFGARSGGGGTPEQGKGATQ